jgi:hypothetical protein
MNLLQHAHITKKTTNKIKTTKYYCGGIMGKSEHVAIYAVLSSLVDKTKPWTGVAGAIVEQQHVFLIFNFFVCVYVQPVRP